ncbi:MAG: guanylyltransferase [bacterium]|nr:guanylyltransferase [bacterium]
MKFTELDNKLRIFETAHDHCVLPGIFMVARLDGRNFTRLTKDTHKFEAPFDIKFRDLMVNTTRHLMDCGFNMIYGYTESDEISLLFHPEEASFSRKLRKLNSILAGEASARFSLQLGDMGVFDCRIAQLPLLKDVIDYFRWRNEDSSRNALNAYCYWTLRKDGFNSEAATGKLIKLSNADKNELLFQYGINFNDMPNWQKRGTGVYWEEIEKKGWNPKEKKEVTTKRKRLKTDYELPMKDEYSDFIQKVACSGGARFC